MPIWDKINATWITELTTGCDCSACGNGLFKLYGGRHKAYFMSLKSVLAFQTLKPSMLDKQATNHKSKGKNCSWTLLPGSIWHKTPITWLHLCWKFQNMFWSLKQFDELWVYQGFVVPLNYQTGMQGTLKQCIKASHLFLGWWDNKQCKQSLPRFPLLHYFLLT